MSFTVLPSIIPLLTPLGEAEAHFISCDGLELPAMWGVFQCETLENWFWPNNQVRLMRSISANRHATASLIYLSSDAIDSLRPHILRHKLSPFYPVALERDGERKLRQQKEQSGTYWNDVDKSFFYQNNLDAQAQVYQRYLVEGWFKWHDEQQHVYKLDVHKLVTACNEDSAICRVKKLLMNSIPPDTTTTKTKFNLKFNLKAVPIV